MPNTGLQEKDEIVNKNSISLYKNKIEFVKYFNMKITSASIKSGYI